MRRNILILYHEGSCFATKLNLSSLPAQPEAYKQKKRCKLNSHRLKNCYSILLYLYRHSIYVPAKNITGVRTISSQLFTSNNIPVTKANTK